MTDQEEQEILNQEILDTLGEMAIIIETMANVILNLGKRVVILEQAA
jgi:hypothetical protein